MAEDIQVKFDRLNRIMSTKIIWSGQRFRGSKRSKVPEFMVDSLMEIGKMIRADAIVNASEMCLDTGKLINKIRKPNKPTMDGNVAYIEVKCAAKHALFVHEGTGIYGPKRRAIVTQKPMVIILRTPRQVENAKRNGVSDARIGMIIMTRKVRGQRAKQFLKMALGFSKSGNIDMSRIMKFYKVFFKRAKI